MLKKLSYLSLAAVAFSPISSLAQQPTSSASELGSSAELRTLDGKYGFRDLKFETSVSAVKNLLLVEATGNTKIYRRTTDSYQIGNAQVASIHYFFYKGKLTTVRLIAQGEANSQELLMAFTDLYGPGYKAHDHVEKYVWQGQQVYLGYEQNTLTNKSIVYLWSNKLTAQRRADELQAAPRPTPARQPVKFSSR